MLSLAYDEIIQLKVKKKKKISSDWGGVFHFGIATAIFFGRNPKTNL